MDHPYYDADPARHILKSNLSTSDKYKYTTKRPVSSRKFEPYPQMLIRLGWSSCLVSWYSYGVTTSTVGISYSDTSLPTIRTIMTSGPFCDHAISLGFDGGLPGPPVDAEADDRRPVVIRPNHLQLLTTLLQHLMSCRFRKMHRFATSFAVFIIVVTSMSMAYTLGVRSARSDFSALSQRRKIRPPLGNNGGRMLWMDAFAAGTTMTCTQISQEDDATHSEPPGYHQHMVSLSEKVYKTYQNGQSPCGMFLQIALPKDPKSEAQPARTWGVVVDFCDDCVSLIFRIRASIDDRSR